MEEEPVVENKGVRYKINFTPTKPPVLQSGETGPKKPQLSAAQACRDGKRPAPPPEEKKDRPLMAALGEAAGVTRHFPRRQRPL